MPLRQHKPEAIQLLVGFESEKLQQLQHLMATCGLPLHFLAEEWKGECACVIMASCL